MSNTEIKIKRGTAADIFAVNPILSEGELCVETDTGRMKLGNGEIHWRQLAYINGRQLHSPVFDLGNLSGSFALDFSADKLFQTATLNGGTVTFTKGLGWPTNNASSEVILRLTVTSATVVTWTIVTDWFNQPSGGISAPLSIGTHLFLLRAIGPSIIEGHYNITLNSSNIPAHKSTHATGGVDALTPADIGAASASHTHDDRYYTETEVDTLLAGKLNTSITNLSGSRTVYVDGNRTDTYTADGTIFRPFKTIQAAHDYAVTVTNGPPGAAWSAWYTGQVVIRINAGNYAENLTVTRSNIHFVGAGGAKTRDVIINGRVTLNINENPVGTRDSNLVSFSNLIVYGSNNTTNTLFTAGGTASYLLFFAHMHLSNPSGSEGGSTCKTFEVTNTSAAGIKIEVREMLLGQDYSSLVAMDFNNVSVADIDQLSATSLGTLMELKTTFASISNSKLETTGASGAVAVIRAISSFSGAPATLVLGNSLLVNGNTNGDGIYIGAGAVANVGQVAFNIGTALGTGFAVNGVTGATLISASNTFGVLPVSPFLTNNKVATAITNASLGTSLTRNGANLDARSPLATASSVAHGNSGATRTLSGTAAVQTCSLSANCTFTMPSASPVASFTLVLTQTGSFTAAFTGVKWPSGVAPTITTGANKVDVIRFVSDGTSWYGQVALNY